MSTTNSSSTITARDVATHIVATMPRVGMPKLQSTLFRASMRSYLNLGHPLFTEPFSSRHRGAHACCR